VECYGMERHRLVVDRMERHVMERNLVELGT
jgi:hypothetical protein